MRVQTIYEETIIENAVSKNSSAKVRLWHGHTRDRVCTQFVSASQTYAALSHTFKTKYMALFLSSKSNKSSVDSRFAVSSLQSRMLALVHFLPCPIRFGLSFITILFFFSTRYFMALFGCALNPILIPYCTRTINKLILVFTIYRDVKI